MTEATLAAIDPARWTIVELERKTREPTFAEDVAAGLSSDPKTLSPKYFYDELGSLLFEAICALPEYQVARLESETLRRHAAEIVAGLAPPVRLIELGSGSASKTRPVIEALLARQPKLEYQPVDISRTALEASCASLLREYPELSIHAWAGDYRDAFAELPERTGPAAEAGGSVLVLFLGSTVGNMATEDAEELLRAVRAKLAPGDALLLGTDRVKAPEKMIPAYDDALGVTAAFDLNLLLRIDRELGGDFDLSAFSHRAVWNAEESRIEMQLVSARDQAVRVEALDREFRFAAGEPIVSELSYKFDDRMIDRLARAGGFRVGGRWRDPEGHFGSDLLVAE